MSSKDRARFRGERLSRQLLRGLGEELRTARLSAGLSQRGVGAVAGVSGSHIGRLERAHVPNATLQVFAVVFAVVGMRVSVKAYPEASPIRDIAHARLLARFRAQLASPLRFRTEVPLRVDRGLRAWDGEILARGDSCKVEAETSIHDLQAIDRRIALKMADDGVERVILLVADTRSNRRVLREFGGLIRERYPLASRPVLRQLRAGALPERSGIVVL